MLPPFSFRSDFLISVARASCASGRLFWRPRFLGRRHALAAVSRGYLSRLKAGEAIGFKARAVRRPRGDDAPLPWLTLFFYFSRLLFWIILRGYAVDSRAY